MNNNIYLSSLSIGGYRSFGDIQRFEKFGKINLLIGQNNSGKSNVLKFIHEILTKTSTNKNSSLINPLDKHIPNSKKFSYGTCFNKEMLSDYFSKKQTKNPATLPLLLDVFAKKAQIDGTKDTWFEFDETSSFIVESFNEALESFADSNVYNIWVSMSNFSSGGSRTNDWIPWILNNLYIRANVPQVEFIPAIREVTSRGDAKYKHSGEGLIEELAKLQNPDVHNQELKQRFNAINSFLRDVTDNDTATIEIPHSRDTINVFMNGRMLPLESLGTGIHEVIILASAATTLQGTVICMEEPELHLNPILQKKLIRYLRDKTNNQYVISTHSASLMDTVGAEIYHVNLIENQSVVSFVSSDKHKSEICEHLGYHPSDLLQTNCVIWVEGPSDRIYLNYWIKAVDKELVEGIHYSIMFYGGRLLSHLSGDDDMFLEEFISLRRLNRKGVIVIDSDKESSHKRLNDTKQRLNKEFDSGPGFSWVTKGREIENYLNVDKLKNAIRSTHNNYDLLSGFTQYENNLSIKPSKNLARTRAKTKSANSKNNKPQQASKVKVASHYVENNKISSIDDIDDILDLKQNLKDIVEFINDANPSVKIV